MGSEMCIRDSNLPYLHSDSRTPYLTHVPLASRSRQYWCLLTLVIVSCSCCLVPLWSVYYIYSNFKFELVGELSSSSKTVVRILFCYPPHKYFFVEVAFRGSVRFFVQVAHVSSPLFVRIAESSSTPRRCLCCLRVGTAASSDLPTSSDLKPESLARLLQVIVVDHDGPARWVAISHEAVE